jgi:hypothetical protein
MDLKLQRRRMLEELRRQLLEGHGHVKPAAS